MTVALLQEMVRESAPGQLESVFRGAVPENFIHRHRRNWG